jgi:hypothetical protein
MSAGLAQAAYPTWFVFSVCCAAASGKMLMTSLDDGFRSQALLSAATFVLWSALATLFFWGTA